MWVRTQDNEIRKVDNIYSHNGFVISTYDGEAPIVLARYETEEETLYVINRFWEHLIEGGRTFKMPMKVRGM